VDDDTRLPDGPDIGLRALLEAIARAHPSSGPITRGEDALYGESRVSASVVEALFWIAALDDHFQGVAPDYFNRRDSEPGGRTVGGLVYARNLGGHGLHAASAVRYEVGAIGSGRPLLSAYFRWAQLADLPKPGRTEKRDRDRMYEERVAGQPLSEPLRVAHEWLKAMHASVS
jgi:hypothetical protein